jgi:hypothetical protein
VLELTEAVRVIGQNGCGAVETEDVLVVGGRYAVHPSLICRDGPA